MNVSLIVTEYCNLKCPNCIHRIPYLKSRRHFPRTYFEWLSEVLTGTHIESLFLDGGEPTIHPQFNEFASKWREWFDIDNLILTTNGCGLKDVVNNLQCFNQIQLTEYRGINDDIVKWTKSEEIKGLYVGGGEQFPLGVQPYKNTEKPLMCIWRNCRIVWEEKIWICAGAENIDNFVQLGEPRWLDKLNSVDRIELCRNCFVPEFWRTSV